MKQTLVKLIEDYLPASEYSSSEPEIVSQNDLIAFEQAIKQYFMGFFTPGFVNTRWQLPADYQAFLSLGIRITYTSDGALEEDIYAYDQVQEATTQPWYDFDMDELKKRVEANQVLQFDTLWLNIGWWGDKHEYFICCDQSHPYFGKVVDGHDSTPWGSAYFSEDYNSFTGFLEALLQEEEDEY
ncbi:MAG TPA: hypothetical protein DCS93_36220 [Microscillaceae bacterium]|nr:hypothetical protein [Microscillaceae bacterium]